MIASRVWPRLTLLVLSVVVVIAIGIYIDPNHRSHRNRLKGVPKGFVPRLPIERVDQFHAEAEQFSDERFNFYELTDYDRMPERGTTLYKNSFDLKSEKEEALKAAFLRAPVPRERIEYHARLYPQYRVHSWLVSLDTIFGPDMAYHRFFVTAVFETPKGNFGQSIHFEGVGLVDDYEEEWIYKNGDIKFLKTFFRDVPHHYDSSLRHPFEGPNGPLYPHKQTLGLAVDFANSVLDPMIQQSVRESPSLSVAAVYPGSPAAGSGVRAGDVLLAFLTICEAGIPCPRAMPAAWWEYGRWNPAPEPTHFQQYLVVYRPSLDEVAIPRLLPHRPSDEPWERDPKFHVVRTVDQIIIKGEIEGGPWVWTIPQESIPSDPVAAGHPDP